MKTQSTLQAGLDRLENLGGWLVRYPDGNEYRYYVTGGNDTPTGEDSVLCYRNEQWQWINWSEWTPTEMADTETKLLPTADKIA